MKVILQQDVKGQGKKGQLVEVSDGYARNFLLPKNLAVEATAAAMNAMQIQNAAKEHHLAEERAHAMEQGAKLKDKTVRVEATCGAGGRLFGAVTGKEVADAIAAQYGISVPKNKLTLPDTVKSIGTFTIKVKLHTDVNVPMVLSVEEKK